MSKANSFTKLALTNPYKSALLALALLHAFFSLFASDSNDIRHTEERLLEVGRLTAHSVFFGSVAHYKDLVEPGIELEKEQVTRIQNCQIEPVSLVDLSRNKRHLLFAFNGDDRVDALKRYSLLRADIVSGHYATLTYSVSSQDSSDPLWHKSFPILVTVSLKYSNVPKIGLFKEFSAQLLNAKYLPDGIRKYVSGDWGVLGEIHSWCAQDYYKAVLSGKDDVTTADAPTMTNEQVMQIVHDALAKADEDRNFVFKSFVDRPFEQFKSAIDDLRFLKGLPPLPEDDAGTPGQISTN